jgi:hypothetical protein
LGFRLGLTRWMRLARDATAAAGSVRRTPTGRGKDRGRAAAEVPARRAPTAIRGPGTPSTNASRHDDRPRAKEGMATLPRQGLVVSSLSSASAVRRHLGRRHLYQVFTIQ